MTISERIETARRERRVLTRVSRAGWRLEQAERERTWALVSARAEGISIRTFTERVISADIGERPQPLQLILRKHPRRHRPTPTT